MAVVGWAKQIDVFLEMAMVRLIPHLVRILQQNHPQLMVCDVDNQHGTDIVFDIPDNHVSYYLKNDGLGAFTQVLIKNNYDVTAVCDWNNDNKIDFVAVGWDPIHNTLPTGTYIILNDGADTFCGATIARRIV